MQTSKIPLESGAPLSPENEAARVAALRKLRVLDTPPSPALDDLTQLASFICQTPMAFITLIDSELQWIKSSVGIEVKATTPRDQAFCNHTILHHEMMIVADTKNDARFADHPAVTGEAPIRFYAGTPLRDGEGHALGALCVIDRVPRQLSAEQQNALRALGRQAMAQLEMAHHSQIAAQMACAAEEALAAQRQSEDALQRAHDELEVRVAQRVAELSHANRILDNEIVERESVENALRESDLRFHVLIEAMPQIMWTATPEGNLNYYNQRWYDYTGLSFEQTKDWGWKPVLHPDDIADCIERWTHSFTTGEEYNVEYRFKRADGVFRWHLGRALPLRGASGEIISWVGTCTDIDDQKQAQRALSQARDQLELRVAERTEELSEANRVLEGEIAERRQTEIALRESEERFRAFMNSSSALAFMKSSDGRYVYVNEPLCRRFDIRPEDWLGKTDFDLQPLEIAAHVSEHDRLVLAGEEPVQLLEVMPTPDGKSDCWLVYKFPLRDAAGTKYLAAIALDITEQKRAEAALQETTMLQRAILDSADYSVIATDLEGTITVFNAASEAWLGYSAEEIIGRQTPALWHDPLEMANRAAALAAESGEPVAIDFGSFTAKMRQGFVDESEWTYIRKDGSRFPVLLSLTGIRDANGECTGILGIATDITRRKEAEAALERQTQELIRSNAELEQFAYVASHDLQEPLRMVVSYLQLLEKRQGDKFDDNAREFMGYAVDGAFRMQRLIHDLLDYSRLGTRGKAFAPVDCNALAQSALSNLQVALQESGAQVTIDTLPTIHGDASQLGRLFQNLIGNAVKFCDEHPPEVHIGARDDGHEWSFWVRDNGIGIAPEYHERVFAVFQRLHGRTEYAGTGIGLAICRKIVERHKGRIWIESAPGEGATFRWTIPKVPQVASAVL